MTRTVISLRPPQISVGCELNTSGCSTARVEKMNIIKINNDNNKEVIQRAVVVYFFLNEFSSKNRKRHHHHHRVARRYTRTYGHLQYGRGLLRIIVYLFFGFFFVCFSSGNLMGTTGRRKPSTGKCGRGAGARIGVDKE